MISELYGPPSYREVVPIYITAITFPLIFGLMFPDLGHGLVLLIAGIIFYSILGRENRSYRELGELVIYVSLAAIITGILSGEFFGPATPASKYIEEHLYGGTTPPLAVPIGKKEGGAVGEALKLLIFISLRIGGATLVLSTLLGMVNSLLERDFEKMITRDIPRLLLFSSVAAPVFIYQDIETAGQTYGYLAFITPSPGGLEPDVIKGLLYLGLAWIFLGEVAVESLKHGVVRGIKKLADGFMEFFDTVIILIGNTISYLRIMGIALAHIAIIIAFYQPVKSMIDAGGIISLPAWILYAVGNLLDIGLESIVAFAHTLRLHLYEMFGKFYIGVGRPYEPLRPPMIRVEIRR
jgi:V/A-type H+-transporting ATPase subunit I